MHNIGQSIKLPERPCVRPSNIMRPLIRNSHPESNDHVTYDVTWPPKVTIVALLSLRLHISITMLETIHRK